MNKEEVIKDINNHIGEGDSREFIKWLIQANVNEASIILDFIKTIEMRCNKEIKTILNTIEGSTIMDIKDVIEAIRKDRYE